MYKLLSFEPRKPSIELKGAGGDTTLFIEPGVEFIVNGVVSEITDLKAGDQIVLVTKFGMITRIAATRDDKPAGVKPAAKKLPPAKKGLPVKKVQADPEPAAAE